MRFSVKTADPGALRCRCVIVPVLREGASSAEAGGVDRQVARRARSTRALASRRPRVQGRFDAAALRRGLARSRASARFDGRDAKVSEKSFREATLAGDEACRHRVVVRSACQRAARGEGRHARPRVADFDAGARRAQSRVPLRRRSSPRRTTSTRCVPSRSRSWSRRRRPRRRDGRSAAPTAIANGVDLAKDLGNLPGNLCTPAYLAADRAIARPASSSSRSRCSSASRCRR